MSAVLWCLAVALLLFLAAVQLGSDAIFSAAGSPQSLPAHLPARTGVAIYRAIARVAPAPYVHAMLARAAMARGDMREARTRALQLPPSPQRSDLLGHIAQAQGDERSAQRYFLAAGDIFEINRSIDALASRDPAAAYQLEERLKTRLQRAGTHPDAVAQAYWRLGVLAIHQGHPRLAIAQYRRAIALSPLSAKFLLSAGFQSFDLGRLPDAESYFRRALAVDPCNADAFAGMGMVAAAHGQIAAAKVYAARSEACDPHAAALPALLRRLK